METNVLKNGNGVIVELLDYGARIHAIKIPTENGLIDISLGYGYAEGYNSGDVYIGAICGRYANRIANGKFTMEGTGYQLDCNQGKNHIHGGEKGFHVKNWNIKQTSKNSVVFNLLSEDKDENYPGNLNVDVDYFLTDKNELKIEFEATTDIPTIINLTSHPYFNLKGFNNGNCLDHVLEIKSDHYTPLLEDSIPIGQIDEIKGTPFNFSKPKALSEAMNFDNKQIIIGKGIDHNWVLNKEADQFAFAARLTEPESGRKLEVYTTQPGLQVYTGNHFDGSGLGKNQNPMIKHCGVALEPQNFPDAPNNKNFPNSVLLPGELYHQIIVYKFYF